MRQTITNVANDATNTFSIRSITTFRTLLFQFQFQLSLLFTLLLAQLQNSLAFSSSSSSGFFFQFKNDGKGWIHSRATTTTLRSTSILTTLTTTAPPQQNIQQYNQYPTLTVKELVSGNAPWNALVGEADRAFKYAIALEKNGRSRAAATAFFEAATLYQCFLDRPSEFGHVTAIQDRKECYQILAYATLSLGFLNLDCLQSPDAAARLYYRATQIDPTPTAVGYDGHGQSLEAAGMLLSDAILAYRRALQLQPNNRKVQFHLAVALDRMKYQKEYITSPSSTTNTTTTIAKESDDPWTQESNQLLEMLSRQEAKHSCLVDSWGYVRWHMRRKHQQQPSATTTTNLNLYAGTRTMLELALKAAQPLLLMQQQHPTTTTALVCEFGVGSGRSLRMIQEILSLNQMIHGFDTFTGLPQAWNSQPIGTYSTGGVLPVLEEGNNIILHKGLFRDTIPPFWEAQQQQSSSSLSTSSSSSSSTITNNVYLAYAAIDCRLYSSTLEILENLHQAIVPGTILVFSEYICHPTWRQDEFRAWRECCKRFGWKYEYLAFSLFTKQAIVRVTSA